MTSRAIRLIYTQSSTGVGEEIIIRAINEVAPRLPILTSSVLVQCNHE